MNFHEAKVVDLYAGTGALGIEAISLGAGSVRFVEISRKAVKHLKMNIASLDLGSSTQVIVGDAFKYLEMLQTSDFDLIFADPPYELEEMTQLPELALSRVKQGGLFVLEHDKRHSFKSHPLLDTSRPYGRTTVSIFENK